MDGDFEAEALAATEAMGQKFAERTKKGKVKVLKIGDKADDEDGGVEDEGGENNFYIDNDADDFSVM